MIRVKQGAIRMEAVTDGAELARARAQDERFERNWKWFEGQAADIYARYRASVCAFPEKKCSRPTRLKRRSHWRARPIPMMTAVLLVIFPTKGCPAFMRINGLWHLCDDGVLRPIIRGEILAGDGSWVKALFLVDIGADRTVFSADVLKALNLETVAGPDHLSGVGGAADSVVVDTRIRVTHDEADKAVFIGQFAAFVAVEALDMSVLGRDILNLFASIVDRQGDVVCLLAQPHYYTIGKR
jgi:hypothetical protein